MQMTKGTTPAGHLPQHDSVVKAGDKVAVVEVDGRCVQVPTGLKPAPDAAVFPPTEETRTYRGTPRLGPCDCTARGRNTRRWRRASRALRTCTLPARHPHEASSVYGGNWAAEWGGGAPHHNGGRGGDENVFWRKPFEAQLQLLINLQAHTLLVATAECSDSLSLSLVRT